VTERRRHPAGFAFRRDVDAPTRSRRDRSIAIDSERRRRAINPPMPDIGSAKPTAGDGINPARAQGMGKCSNSKGIFAVVRTMLQSRISLLSPDRGEGVSLRATGPEPCCELVN
jgi:hypothetical protein